MPTKTTKRTQPDWPHHVQAHQQSGLSRAEYCRQADLDYDQFGYHARKCQAQLTPRSAEAETHQHVESDFVPVVLPYRREHPKNEFTMTRTDGTTLSWSVDWTPQQVLEFVSGWKSQC